MSIKKLLNIESYTSEPIIKSPTPAIITVAKSVPTKDITTDTITKPTSTNTLSASISQSISLSQNDTLTEDPVPPIHNMDNSPSPIIAFESAPAETRTTYSNNTSDTIKTSISKTISISENVLDDSSVAVISSDNPVETIDVSKKIIEKGAGLYNKIGMDISIASNADVASSTNDISANATSNNVVADEMAYVKYGSVENRRFGVTKFSFEYLSFLFFDTDINVSLPNFYSAIDVIIRDKAFARAEDYGVVADEDVINPETMQIIFSKMWEMASRSNDAVKNLIGFYIYFNRRLRFLPILIQGDKINKFIAELTLESVVDRIMSYGLYPINNTNMFDRLWKSYIYSVNEDSNKAEVKMSLKEYLDYDLNRNMDETNNGLPRLIDQLVMVYDLDLSKWSNKKVFSRPSVAFKRFKEIILKYITADPDATPAYVPPVLKTYLLNLLPNANTMFLRDSIVSDSSSAKAPEYYLWSLMESFDDVFKISRLRVNKEKMRTLFMEFANDVSFPIAYIDGNDFTEVWSYWVEYINVKAVAISVELTDPDGIGHDYANMYNELVWLVNAKFIIQYLEHNNLFQATGNYTDGTIYIDEALDCIYASMIALKNQIKTLITYVTKEDSKFYSTNAQ